MEVSSYAVSSGQNNGCSSMEVSRPLRHSHPDIWGNYFLSYTPPSQDTLLQKKQELEKLKEEVRKKLLTMGDDVKEKIVYIDAIEQLGVAYHFEEEIEAILRHSHDMYCNHDGPCADDLYYVPLKFRILRQHGFLASCDVFEKFKGEDGSFEECMSRDIEDILSLYEASYLRMHGENILIEAMEFSRAHLQSLVDKLSEPLATRVSRALKLPLHRVTRRIHSRYYIDIYENSPSHDKILLRFAKIDFNLLQSLHLKELRDLSRWWKSLDFSTKLPVVRDRIVQAYCWALGTFYEPQYALGRATSTKIWKMLTIMDDIYDAFGLFEELKLYTEAILRWDKNSCMKQLPNYMKIAYENLLDTFDGMEQDLAREGRSHLMFYVRELMKDQCRAYMQEGTWLHEKYNPTYDEYMEKVGIPTASHALLGASVLLGMEEFANEEAFEWVSQHPKSVKAASVIGRLFNDIVGYKKQHNKNQIATAVECFMLQYNVSDEEAIKKLYNKVEEAWMDINEEVFRPKKYPPRPLLTLIVNLSRALEFLYRIGDDEFTDVTQNVSEKIQALLIDPVIL